MPITIEPGSTLKLELGMIWTDLFRDRKALCLIQKAAEQRSAEYPREQNFKWKFGLN